MGNKPGTRKRRQKSFTLASFLDLAKHCGAGQPLIDRLRRLFNDTKKRGLHPCVEGMPDSGELPYISVAWLEVDLDGSLTVNADAAMDADAASPGWSADIAKQLSTIPAFKTAADVDFIGGTKLSSKLGDLSDGEIQRLLAFML